MIRPAWCLSVISRFFDAVNLFECTVSQLKLTEWIVTSDVNLKDVRLDVFDIAAKLAPQFCVAVADGFVSIDG